MPAVFTTVSSVLEEYLACWSHRYVVNTQSSNQRTSRSVSEPPKTRKWRMWGLAQLCNGPPRVPYDSQITLPTTNPFSSPEEELPAAAQNTDGALQTEQRALSGPGRPLAPRTPSCTRSQVTSDVLSSQATQSCVARSSVGGLMRKILSFLSFFGPSTPAPCLTSVLFLPHGACPLAFPNSQDDSVLLEKVP